MKRKLVFIALKIAEIGVLVGTVFVLRFIGSLCVYGLNYGFFYELLFGFLAVLVSFGAICLGLITASFVIELVKLNWKWADHISREDK